MTSKEKDEGPAESGMSSPVVADKEIEIHTEALPERGEEDAALEDESDYATGLRLGLIVTGLALSVLLVALDNAILSTAIPTITTAFNSLPDVGWYGSAFLIAICALQPLSGKLYQHFSLKWTYLVFLALFELGSLICGVAQSSRMLIVGRAVAGMGAAGLFSGALNIISNSIPLRLRPFYIGIIVGAMQIANVLGPLIGGALTQHTSWRWCFFINLPAGLVTALLLFFFFHPVKREASQLSFFEKTKRLDLLGFVLFIPAVVMLLLAVQWGGTKYAWNSATVIGLFGGFAGMIAIFIAWQWHAQDEASIPPRILMNSDIAFASVVSFFLFGSLQLVVYFLPIWFQVIKGATPTQSGIDFIPVVLASMLFTIIAGGLVTKLGYYNPWVLFGTAMMATAGGLFSTLHVDSTTGQWIGYEIIFGAGTGASMPMALISVMAVLPQNEIPIGNGVVVFSQFLGGAIFLAIAESIFSSHLLSEITANAPNIDAQAVIDAGAAAVAAVVSPENLPAVIKAYNIADTTTFYVGMAGGAAAFISTFGMRWVSVKGKSLVGGAA